MDRKFDFMIDRELRRAEQKAHERKKALLAEILAMVPDPPKALATLADSTIESLEALVRKLRELHKKIQSVPSPATDGRLMMR